MRRLILLQLMRELEFIRCCTTQLIDNRLVLFLVTDLPTTQSHSSDDHILSESTGVDNVSIIKKAVIDRIRCQLPSHYTPDDVVVIENLPVTKHGKLSWVVCHLIYEPHPDNTCLCCMQTTEMQIACASTQTDQYLCCLPPG